MLHHALRSLIVVGVAALIVATPASASPNTIYIPKIGVYEKIGTNLDAGPIAWYEDHDTLALAAHRTTHSKPFSGLQRLSRGDLIRVRGKNYRVAKTVVIRPWQMWVLNWKGLVLSACARSDGSPTSLSYRIVVLAK